MTATASTGLVNTELKNNKLALTFPQLALPNY